MIFKKGNVIDIVATASAPRKHDLLKGICILEEWGFKVNLPSDSISPWLFHSNTNSKRLTLLKNAFKNSSSQIIWSARGGYGTQKLMPAFQKISFEEKLFIGFSDVTALHLYLNGVCKIPSLHAPSVCDLPYLSNKELHAIHNMLFKDSSSITSRKLKSLNNNKSKNIKGTFIGGNLTLLQTSIGTSWFPSLSSKIVFLEDTHERDYRIDRALHHLHFSGALKGVRALVFGYLNSIKLSDFKKIIESFSEVSKIPVFYQILAGHKSPNLPLPLGMSAEISKDAQGFNLEIKRF